MSIFRLLPRKRVRPLDNTPILVLYMAVKVEIVPSDSTAFMTRTAVEGVSRLLAGNRHYLVSPLTKSQPRRPQHSDRQVLGFVSPNLATHPTPQGSA